MSNYFGIGRGQNADDSGRFIKESISLKGKKAKRKKHTQRHTEHTQQ